MTQKVGYAKRECTDMSKIEALLLETKVGIIGLSDDGMPYAVPVNFVWHEGSVCFHGMGSGRKVTVLSKNPSVCFTVYKQNGTVSDPVLPSCGPFIPERDDFRESCTGLQFRYRRRRAPDLFGKIRPRLLRTENIRRLNGDVSVRDGWKWSLCKPHRSGRNRREGKQLGTGRSIPSSCYLNNSAQESEGVFYVQRIEYRRNASSYFSGWF